MIATFRKKIISYSGAIQRVYKVEPPLDGFEHVTVSAVVAPHSGPETYVFGSDVNGNITDWAELPGSYRGGLSHSEALNRAGYEEKDEDSDSD